MSKRLLVAAFSIMFLCMATSHAETLRFTTTDDGRIDTFEVREKDSWRSIPFRTDQWGTSWYVRDRDGTRHPIPMTRDPERPNSSKGVYGDVHFRLSYNMGDTALAIKATIANRGKTEFRPMTAGLRLGVDSYQANYPTWNDKLMPNVMRCEPSHHWGFAMSPGGAILGWVCPFPVASYSVNYEPRLHRIYTPNIDFINQRPLPSRHPQNLDTVKPGEIKSWTVYLMPISSQETVKSTLSNFAKVPIFDAERYTILSGEQTRVSILGPKIKSVRVIHPQKAESTLTPAKQQLKGQTDYRFHAEAPGLYTFRAVCENGKEAEGSIFVRHPWKWYLEKARLEGLRVKPTKTHHAECVFPFFSYFLAKKYFPDTLLDEQCEEVFQEYFPQHYDFEEKKLKVDFRIQDSAVWAGILADRFAVTGDEKDLEYAANLVDFLLSRQEDDGGYYARYRNAKHHYTSVAYLAKSIMEVMKEERKLAENSEEWKKRYQRHRRSVGRAIADLERRRDNIGTEGQGTYEDGMISCSMTQLAMYALKTKSAEEIAGLVDAAEYLYNGHRSLTLTQHPDARVNGSTIRFWETQYTICLMANMYNSPCGWSAWKLYGDYYLYLLTGNERYLKETFNGLGACIQLIDWQSGRMRWGFTPDPFIYTEWAVPAKSPDEEKEHDWVTGVRGEEYLEQISNWNRSKKIWREKWGIDNFTHETFKCMEEAALCNAYVIQRADGSYVGYNCRVESNGPEVIIHPVEDTISRIHLNLRKPTQISTTIQGKLIQETFHGMKWIGPGGVPEDLRPL